jgi:hypothetical protein
MIRHQNREAKPNLLGVQRAKEDPVVSGHDSLFKLRDLFGFNNATNFTALSVFNFGTQGPLLNSQTGRLVRAQSGAVLRLPSFSALRRIADAGSHGRLEADTGLSWAQQYRDYERRLRSPAARFHRRVNEEDGRKVFSELCSTVLKTGIEGQPRSVS